MLHVFAIAIEPQEDSRGTNYLQSGLVVDGLATTIPELAPGALLPEDPMLFSTPWRAIGLSVATKLSSDPVALLWSSSGSAGRAEHDKSHTPPIKTSATNGCRKNGILTVETACTGV